jgi:hypothetical protein
MNSIATAVHNARITIEVSAMGDGVRAGRLTTAGINNSTLEARDSAQSVPENPGTSDTSG